jgi:hypothetical protein
MLHTEGLEGGPSAYGFVSSRPLSHIAYTVFLRDQA